MAAPVRSRSLHTRHSTRCRLCNAPRSYEVLPADVSVRNDALCIFYLFISCSALYAWEQARPVAIEAFKKQRPYMHDTTASMVAKDLKLL